MPRKRSAANKRRQRLPQFPHAIFAILLGIILALVSYPISLWMYNTGPVCIPPLPGAFPFYQYSIVPAIILAVVGAATVALKFRDYKLVAIFLVVYAAVYLLGSALSANNLCPIALYSLGERGYLFVQSHISTQGSLSFVFGSLANNTMYNLGFACVGYSGSGNLTAYPYLVYATGQVSGVAAKGSDQIANPLQLAQGQNVSVYSLPCYWANGTAIGSLAAGTKVLGYLYLTYTNSSASPSPANLRISVLSGLFGIKAA